MLSRSLMSNDIVAARRRQNNATDFRFQENPDTNEEQSLIFGLHKEEKLILIFFSFSENQVQLVCYSNQSSLTFS